jgi:hypothetical protein
MRTKRPEPARAVHHRRLLELLRDSEQEAAQRPDGEWEHERQVGEDQAEEHVVPREAVVPQDDEERDHETGLRQHLDRDHERR